MAERTKERTSRRTDGGKGARGSPHWEREGRRDMRSRGDWMAAAAAPPMGVGARVPGFKREFIFPLLLLKEGAEQEAKSVAEIKSLVK